MSHIRQSDMYITYQYSIDNKLTFSLTFSKEAGETTEKQTKKTSVCG